MDRRSFLLTALAGTLPAPLAAKPDIIVAVAPQPARAAKDATSTIPIVFVNVADPIALGVVTNLGRPGGNVTGLSTLVPGGFTGKMLELLKEAVPTASRIAVSARKRCSSWVIRCSTGPLYGCPSWPCEPSCLPYIWTAKW